MPGATVEAFEQRVLGLKRDLVEQGRRAQRMLDDAVEAVFGRDDVAAQRVLQADLVVDRVDVEIERAAVDLLCDVAREPVPLSEKQIRWLLTVVKVNNELERIADEACAIAERVEPFSGFDQSPPDRFRVMANSVIGIVRAAVDCFDKVDTRLAQVVLASDDAVEEFEQAILREMQQGIADGSVAVDFAFAMTGLTSIMERIDDHCTNIAEQVIYVATGKVVRHMQGHWTAPEQPD